MRTIHGFIRTLIVFTITALMLHISDATAQCSAPVVVSPVKYCLGSTATALSATGTGLNWTNGISGVGGGTAAINSGAMYVAQDVNNNQKTHFTVNGTSVVLSNVDYYITAYQAVAILKIGIFNSSGTLVASSSTTTTQASLGTLVKVSNAFNYTFPSNGTYSIGIVSGAGNIAYYTPSFPVTETNNIITLTGAYSGGKCGFNNIKFTAGTTTAPVPSTATTGTTTYTVTQTIGACTSPAATITVNVSSNSQTPTVANQLLYYRLDGNANDFNGINNGTLQGAPTLTTDRFGNANKAYTLNGTSQYISSAGYFINFDDYTASVRFKTTTTQGGTLIGYGNAQTGNSTSNDRHLYMDNTGLIRFSMGYNHNGNPVTSTAYNDGNWHMATATYNPLAGIKLYMDGVLVDDDPTVNQTIYINGYWRIGFENFSSSGNWPSPPSSNYFAGTIDDAIIFNRVLSAAEISSYYKSPDGASNNGPVAVGATLTLSAPTISGASYLWTGPNGFTSTQQNPALTFSLAAQGIYNLQINGNGCSSFTEVTPVSKAGQWAGGYSADWTNASNWADQTVPVAATDVTIPAGKSYYPVVSTTQPMKGLSVLTGGSVTVNAGTLKIGAAISNKGKFDVSAGTIEFNGSSAQTIAANTFANNTIKNLIISNAVSLAGEDTLTGTLSFGASNKVFTTNDFLTLESNASGTARVADLTGGASGYSGNSIIGKVNVERYLPLRRAWRLLSATVAAATAPTINAAWQEGATTASSNANPVPGYGVFITGGTTANGFDQGVTSSPSIKVFNGTGFVALPATGTNLKITNYPGYFVYVRGDRSINLTAGTGAAVNATTLRVKGELNQNTQNIPVNATGFTVVGNPYASAINFATITKTNVKNGFYMWDPNLAGSYGYGGYVTFLYNSHTGTYDKTASAGTLSQYIPSGTAIIVQSLNGTTAGSLSVKETDKFAGTAGNIYNFTGGIAGVQSQIRVDLLGINTDGSAGVLDGVLTTFDEDNSNAVNDDDASKINGGNENIGLSRSGNMLAIERRHNIENTDTIFLNIYQMKVGNYRLSVSGTDMYAQGMSAVLKDNYSNTINDTPINTDGVTNIDFAITSDPASYNINRFSIVFRPAQVLPLTFTSINAYRSGKANTIEWKTENEINIHHYDVERSANGATFTKINTTAAAGINGAAANYTAIDNAPFAGTNYYRVNAVSANGVSQYSSIVKVTADAVVESAQIKIYPNPVTGNNIGIQLDLEKGNYELQLFNSKGQIVAAKTINYSGGKSTISFTTLTELSTGVYELKVAGEGVKVAVAVLKQ